MFGGHYIFASDVRTIRQCHGRGRVFCEALMRADEQRRLRFDGVRRAADEAGTVLRWRVSCPSSLCHELGITPTEKIEIMWTTLILEDNALYRQSLVRIFDVDFPAMMVFEADTGQKAHQIANAELLDLVVADIDLPDMRGLDFVREVKQGSSRTVVVVLTIHDEPEYRLAAREHGADYFLVKGSTGTADIVALVESLGAQPKKSEDRCDYLYCQLRIGDLPEP